MGRWYVEVVHAGAFRQSVFCGIFVGQRCECRKIGCGGRLPPCCEGESPEPGTLLRVQVSRIASGVAGLGVTPGRGRGYPAYIPVLLAFRPPSVAATIFRLIAAPWPVRFRTGTRQPSWSKCCCYGSVPATQYLHRAGLTTPGDRNFPGYI